MAALETDVLIVGGGLTGCAVASRIKHGKPSLSVTIVEAGPDPTGDPRVTPPLAAFALAFSDLDWAYMTVPQRHTNNRPHYNAAGKTLGGGSVLNYGGWTRGDTTDYDEWARVVEDRRWNYEGWLPYFKRSEHCLNAGDASPKSDQHGFKGPMRYVAVSQSDAGRKYGLREPIKNAWTELGVPFNPDANNGSVLGLSEVDENWNDGVRQPSHLAYSLRDVQVITNALVQQILFDKNKSDNSAPHISGVLLADGRQILVKKEVIISAGAHRTPQILMLSGIGPSKELRKHGVPVVVDCPSVGASLFDHYSLFQFWKLRPSDQGLALGTHQWALPAFSKGLPIDWVVKEHIPSGLLEKAFKADATGKAEIDALGDPARPHVETLVLYAAGPSHAVGLDLPMDGTYIATSVMLTVPTSRGQISLISSSIKDKPVVDPDYYSTAFDRTCLIHGTRRVMQALLETKAGKKVIESEVVPPGTSILTAQSTDEEIDARIRAAGMPHAHAAGSAAMGKVVDSKLKVFGVHGLRVADSSVFPVAISGHPQATLYALAETLAELVLEDLVQSA